MSEDIDMDIDSLIKAVKSKPVLWDKTDETYKDRNGTRQAWQDVFMELRNDFEQLGDDEKNAFGKEIVRKWKHVRDAYAKSLKNSLGMKASGKKRKKYIYDDQLKFLYKIYSGKQSEESNDSLVENENESHCEVILEIGNSPTDGNAANPQTHEKSLNSTANSGPQKSLKLDDFESKLLKALEEQKPNRHLSFFKSIVPHLEKFDDDEVLQFQMGVLQLISNMNQRKRIVTATTPSIPFANFMPPHSQEMTLPHYMHAPSAALYSNVNQTSTLNAAGPSKKPSRSTSSSSESTDFTYFP